MVIKMIKVIPAVLLAFFSAALYLGAEYNGQRTYAKKVYDNCIQSRISKGICSSYIRIIEDGQPPLKMHYTERKKPAPAPTQNNDPGFFRHGI